MVRYDHFKGKLASMTRRTMLALAAAAPLRGAAKTWPVSIFSKHLHWADWSKAAVIAAECGFDGIDLTVRKNGHVEPERVRQDLPLAAKAIRAAGLKLTMITTDVVDAATPHAEAVLAAAAELGVTRYRWGGFKYTRTAPVAAQIEALRPRIEGLAKLNKRLGMCAMYHTHSGFEQVGGPIWDLYSLLKDQDPGLVSFNLDIGHMTIEGGFGDWITSARAALPFTRGTAIKDFKWEKNAKGEWRPEWCPIGEGMVNLRGYIGLLREGNFDGPVQMHFEYESLGGAQHGARTLAITESAFKQQVEVDLTALRSAMTASA